MNNTSSTAVPGWFRIVAIVFLLWNLLGCFMFWTHYNMTPDQIAALTPEQQTLWNNLPGWSWFVYGGAVISGAIGSVLLVMRKPLALPFFWLSLACVLVQLAMNFLPGGGVEVMGAAKALPFPVFIVAIAALQVWFTRNGAARRWIR